MNRIESIILRSLLFNQEYTRKVIPFIQEGYFEDSTERAIFTRTKEFLWLYNELPTREALALELEKTGSFSQEEFDVATRYLDELAAEKENKLTLPWLVAETESWCKQRAIYIALYESMHLLDDQENPRARGGIPKLLQDALSVSFDPHVGHDLYEDAAERYDFYTLKEKRIPFHLHEFNRVTKNGITPKTLNVIVAGTGVGKSLVMCDFAAYYLRQGKQVLYITMEMSEEAIAERIDANLLDVITDKLRDQSFSKEQFVERVEAIRQENGGRLIIKEYPTSAASVIHFKHALNELNLKKHFVPDIIMVDYLNICQSARIKSGSSGGSYEMAKAIAEELRGLAVEQNVPIWTATQLNRSGHASSDPDMTNTSESFGVPATADFMVALIIDDDILQQNQMMVKILKNRYHDAFLNRKFLIGVERAKMRLFNLDDSAQNGLSEANRSIEKKEPATASLVLEDENYLAPRAIPSAQFPKKIASAQFPKKKNIKT